MAIKYQRDTSANFGKRLLFLLVMTTFLIVPFGAGSLLAGSIAYTVYTYEQSFSTPEAEIPGKITGFDRQDECRYDSNHNRNCTYYYIVNFEYSDTLDGVTQDSRTVYQDLWKSLKNDPSSFRLERSIVPNYPDYLLPITSFFGINTKEPAQRIKGEDEMFTVYLAGFFSVLLGISALWTLLYALRATLDRSYYKKCMAKQQNS
ncbi:MAG: hypothetical protein OXR68_06875 [Alphaproteobacteria bacterium]|nr:hypothetical protein [Alphaproteobacteria bacterium]MDD9920328.1 hypothetical protein [Alphaproteobacteria bacterium]